MNKSSSVLINRRTSRTVFANIIEQKKAIADGKQLRISYVTDNTNSILATFEAGAVATTVTEYDRYSGVSAVASPQEPAAPVILGATVGNGELIITFTEPYDGGSPILNYEYSFDEENYYEFDPDVSSSPVTVTNLTNGTPYSITLKAVNEVGAGPASGPITATPLTTPGAPTITSITSMNTSLALQFTVPANGGSPITDYEYSLNGGAFVSLSTTISPATITGLTNGTSYSIRIRAVNSVGAGSISGSSSGTPSSTPSAPTGLVATAGDGQVSISFTAGANNGSAITNYKYSINGGTSYSAFSPADTSSPVVITGLTNGTTYSIKLRAVNAIGDGAQSDAVSATPVSSVPSGNIYTAPTTNVNVDISSVSPFGANGISYNFNGTSDYLTISGDNAWAFGTGAFTIEWFQYQIDSNPFPRIFATSSDSIGCSIESGTLYTWLNGQPNVSASVTPYKSGWHHFALVRNSSGIVTIYKNGISVGSGSHTANVTDNTSILFIGVQEFPAQFNTWFGGYLTNIRIVKGLAVYTGNFTVPTSTLTLTATANPYGGSNTVEIPTGFTKLLLVGIPPPTIVLDPGNVSSYSGSGTTVTSIGTSSGVSGTLSSVSYNASSGGYFTFAGTGTSHISFPQFNFGTEFTLIAWVRPSEQSDINTLFTTTSANQATPGFKVGWNYWQGNTKPMWYEGGNGTSGNSSVSADGIITIGTWQQVAYVFNQASPKIDFYKNGTLLTSSGIPVGDIPMNRTWRIGNMFGSYAMKSDVGLFKIYPSILSTSDIQAEYNSTKSRYGL